MTDRRIGRRHLIGSMGMAAVLRGLPASAGTGASVDTDILVSGGGPAGIGAAVGAARAGAKVMLIERYGFPGGVGAWSVGMTINQMRPGGKPRGAVHEMLIARLKSYGDEAFQLVDHALVCNVEYLKAAILDVLDEAGVRCLLHTRAVDAQVEGGRASAVVAATKQGLLKIAAKAFVDGTGDADIAFFAGAEMGERDAKGFLAPMTLNFIIANVDAPAARAVLARGGARRLLNKARAKYPLLPENILATTLPLANCLSVNHYGTRARGVLDATVTADFTEAERYSRHQIIQIVAALREFGGPPFARVQLATAGAQVGVRETRRIKGGYALTEQDAISGRRFEDVVAWRSGKIDVGGGGDQDQEMKIHDVPYRALLPVKLDSLLAAGRAISATHMGAAAGKSMGNCMATGHAAGLAAAMSAKQSRTPREINVKELQQRLAADGVDLVRG